MTKERNFLFGVMAVQLKKLSPWQLADAVYRWAGDPSRELRDYIADTATLSADDMKTVVTAVEDALASNDNDPMKTLATLSTLGAGDPDFDTLRTLATNASATEIRNLASYTS